MAFVQPEFEGNPEHLAKLREGVEEWNKWVEKKGESFKAKLSGADLVHAKLSGVNLSCADLSGADLNNVNLSGANLSRANLNGASMYYSDLKGIILKGANLSDAILNGADLIAADLRDVDFRGAKLGLINDLSNFDPPLHSANLSSANLNRANLSSTDLNNAVLSGSDMSEANLREANLMSADLKNANLSKADMFRADLKGADLSGSILIGTNMNEANLSGASLIGANLIRADMANSILNETTMADVNLSEVINLDTCYFESRPIIDHLTIAKSTDIPESFLRRLEFSEERIRAYLYGTSITIEFTEEGWGDLIPVEKALKAVLRDGYEVVKSDDRISVKLESPDLVNEALDAVGAVFTALESESSGEVSVMRVHAQGEEEEIVNHEEVMYVLSQLERRYNKDQAPGSFIEETGKGLLESLENLPLGPLVKRWVEWGAAKMSKPDEDEELLQEIYARCKRGFAGLIEIKAIPEKKQLPPAESNSTDLD